MNKQRRNQIEALLPKVEELKDLINSILEEEQEAFDNMPESFQESERGEKSQNAIDCLENAIAELEYLEENLTEAIE